ncbi:hypothetical protein GF312_04110 [Candidatus Poribacteria bacterium]|nr:hypothetical protein [Candidatus Poribacteria bacterium]
MKTTIFIIVFMTITYFSISETSAFDLINDINYHNVRDYGAKGNGVTDDTLAIRKTLDSIKNNGIVFFPAGKYIINGQININGRKGIKFVGINGGSIITTTKAEKDDSRSAFLYFNRSDNCGIYDITFDESAVVNPPTSRAWVADIWAISCENFIVKNCHFIETVSSGITITSGKHCLIDGVTAKGVRGFGYSDIDPVALDGNFISVNGLFANPSGDRGGNIVTNCRIDAYSELTSFHWYDFASNASGGAGIWHDNNCGILTEPLGTDKPDAPNNIVSNNYIAHFGWGGYTENPGGRLGGRQIFDNNIVFECYIGYEIQNTAQNVIISDNYFENLAGDGIYSHSLDNINIADNVFHNIGIHKAANGYVPAVYAIYGISDIKGQSNFKVSGNIILIDKRNNKYGNLLSRPLGIKIRSSAGITGKNIIIQGNIFNLAGSPYDVSTFEGTLLVEGNIRDMIISDNIISNSCGPSVVLTSSPGGNTVDSPERVTISNNHFTNNNIGPGYRAAVVIKNDTRNVTIDGNNVSGNENHLNFLEVRDNADMIYCHRNFFENVKNAYSWMSSGTKFIWDDLIGSNIIIFRNGNTQPDVGMGNEFKTGNTNATSIKNFSNGREGQVINITFGDSNTTIISNQKIRLKGSGKFRGNKYDQISLFYDGSVWMERSRSINH